MGLVEGTLRCIEITEPQAELSNLIPSLSSDWKPVLKFLRSFQSLRLRLNPRTSEPQDLGPINPTDSREDGLGVVLTPFRPDIVPLASTLEI